MELDIQNTQDVIAKKLTGGQKRKLTLGIALLGDPQVRGKKFFLKLICTEGYQAIIKV